MKMRWSKWKHKVIEFLLANQNTDYHISVLDIAAKLEGNAQLTASGYSYSKTQTALSYFLKNKMVTEDLFKISYLDDKNIPRTFESFKYKLTFRGMWLYFLKRKRRI